MRTNVRHAQMGKEQGRLVLAFLCGLQCRLFCPGFFLRSFFLFQLDGLVFSFLDGAAFCSRDIPLHMQGNSRIGRLGSNRSFARYTELGRLRRGGSRFSRRRNRRHGRRCLRRQFNGLRGSRSRRGRRYRFFRDANRLRFTAFFFRRRNGRYRRRRLRRQFKSLCGKLTRRTEQRQSLPEAEPREAGFGASLIV